jgi:xanthine dehydrogenase accessory factor
MSDLFREAARLAEARTPFVWCVVAATERSAPRDGGARMLVLADGAILGTVGGGPLEASVIAEARAMLADPAADGTRLWSAELTVHAEDSIGMKCGGAVQVLLDRVAPAPMLHVFGAGHVGLALCDVARLAGFPVQVHDDRDERLALVPAGVPCRRFDVDAVEGCAQAVRAGDSVVIVTRCHDVDERVLGAMLDTQAGYVGLIGSKAKTAQIFRNLRRTLGRDPSRDPRVYSPIGLALGGKAPGEIAVSVVAELLAVRDGVPAPHRRLPARGGDGVEDES